MSPPYQALAASGTVPTLQNTRPCGCGATASVKIKYGLEASLCRFFAQRTMVWSQTRTQQQVVPLGSDVLSEHEHPQTGAEKNVGEAGSKCVSVIAMKTRWYERAWQLRSGGHCPRAPDMPSEVWPLSWPCHSVVTN